MSKLLIVSAFENKHYLINNVLKMEEIDADMEEVEFYTYFDSNVKESYNNIDKDILDRYVKDLSDFISDIEPTVVVFVGSVFIKLFDINFSISKIRGILHKHIFNNTEVHFIFVFTEKYAEQSDETLEIFANDIRLAYFTALGIEDIEVKNEELYNKYISVDTMEKVDTLIDYVKATGVASYDFETNELDYFRNTFYATSLSISFQVGSSYVIPLYHISRTIKDKGRVLSILDSIVSESIYKEDAKELIDIFYHRSLIDKDIYDIVEVLQELIKSDEDKPFISYATLDLMYKVIDRETFTEEELRIIFKKLNDNIFSNVEVEKIAHNHKFDAHVAKVYGINMRGVVHDTMLMHFAINNVEKHGLKNLVEIYLNSYSGYEDNVSKYAWDSIPWDKQLIYNGLDTDMALRLRIYFESILLEDDKLYLFYRNLLMPLCKVLVEIEHDGVLVDRDYLQNAIRETEDIIYSLDSKLRKHPTVVKFESSKSEKYKKQRLEELKGKYEKEVQRCNDRADKKKIKAIETIKKRLDTLYGKIDNEDNNNKKLLKLKEQVKQYNAKLHEAKVNNYYVESKTLKNISLQLRDIKTGVNKLYDGINFASPKQLGDLLYNKDGFGFKQPYDYRKKQRVKSTNKDVLETLEDDTGFLKDFRILRSIKHTLGTFLKGILSRLDDNDLVHTSYYQPINTGRLSSSNPNLQNIPPEGRQASDIANKVIGYVKKSFIAPKGWVFEEADYSQAELRIIAMYANETNMLNIYKNDGDIHSKTAANLSSMTMKEFLSLSKVDIKLRRFKAKAANFGLIYGLGWRGFQIYAKQNYNLILTEDEAKEIREDFLYKWYPNLLNYHEKYIAKAKKFGGVRTLFGYKRWIPDIDEGGQIGKHSENEAINTPIQGSAGQFTEFSIIMLYFRLDKRKSKIKNSVHDSIHFYHLKEYIKEARNIVKDTMENPPTKEYFDFSIDTVDMKIDIATSDIGWGYLQEL